MAERIAEEDFELPAVLGYSAGMSSPAAPGGGKPAPTLLSSGTARSAPGTDVRPLLDPASWQILQRCLAHRESQQTANPHVMVTKGNKQRTLP